MLGLETINYRKTLEGEYLYNRTKKKMRRKFQSILVGSIIASATIVGTVTAFVAIRQPGTSVCLWTNQRPCRPSVLSQKKATQPPARRQEQQQKKAASIQSSSSSSATPASNTASTTGTPDSTPMTLFAMDPSASASAAETIVLSDYTGAASALFNNMKTPASILAAGMVSLGFLAPFRQWTDVEQLHDPGLYTTIVRAKRAYILVTLVSFSSELLAVIWSTVAVNQLTETVVAPSATVWALLERDFDLAWAATNSHFCLGLLGFMYMIGIRGYVMLLVEGASQTLIAAALTGVSSALCLMVSVINRGVASGGGEGVGYGQSILDLFAHYIVLLYQQATNSNSYGPLEMTAIVLQVSSICLVMITVLNTLAPKNKDTTTNKTAEVANTNKSASDPNSNKYVKGDSTTPTVSSEVSQEDNFSDDLTATSVASSMMQESPMRLQQSQQSSNQGYAQTDRVTSVSFASNSQLASSPPASPSKNSTPDKPRQPKRKKQEAKLQQLRQTRSEDDQLVDGFRTEMESDIDAGNRLLQEIGGPPLPLSPIFDSFDAVRERDEEYDDDDGDDDNNRFGLGDCKSL
ncbi:expressed unknown protein [Seminavis robusta]|uniref:Transmembrane protein n=1 Tax=Seminavis robusta TaxID=568900 RepID=A0A9N8HV55_9STRA|nr:expressed unknown protein [Seminavis robusta]|eukprot:Sro1747_g295050.1 n/a (577) ;mRNA; f:14957-16687